MVNTALEGANAGWTIESLEKAFKTYGAPKYVISDHENVVTSLAFQELLKKWNIEQRLGAVGKHGSIAVTERVILTLKQEWLRRVPLIRGFNHLTKLLNSFTDYYNNWRGHTKLEGAMPAVIYLNRHWNKPEKTSKQITGQMEERFFQETRTTAFRLAA